MLGEESRSGLLEFGRRSHVRERESLAEIDLGDRHFWIKDQLLADVLHPAVIVIIEGCRGVGVYPLVVDLEEKTLKEARNEGKTDGPSRSDRVKLNSYELE